MKRHFFWKLWLATAIPTIVSVGLLIWLLDRQIAHTGREQLQLRLKRTLQRINELDSLGVPGMDASWRRHISGIAAQNGVLVVVSDSVGQVLFWKAPANLLNPPDQPPSRIPTVITSRKAQFSPWWQRPVYRLRQELNHGQGWILLEIPAQLPPGFSSLRRRLWAFGWPLSLGVGIGLAALLAWLVNLPLQNLAQKVRQLIPAPDAPLATLREDEFGWIAAAFNQLRRRHEKRLRQLAAERRKLPAMLDALQEGVLLIDSHGSVVMMNKPAAEFLNCNWPFSAPRSYFEILRFAELQELVRKGLEEKQTLARELRLETEAGEKVLSVLVRPLQKAPGKLEGILLVLDDKTHQIQLETIRRDFVANVSHELKTPITAMQGIVETLLETSDLTVEQQREFLSRLHKQIERMTRLVRDLLTLARWEARPDIQTVASDLGLILKNVYRALKPQAEDRGLEIILEIPSKPLPVLLEDDALEEVGFNLVDNAIKYTPAPGRITLAAFRKGKEAVLEVKDTGIGIEPRHQERIFERFYRVDPARSRELGGTGLGLAIVKHIVESSGGRVEVESTPGHGSTFRVMVPLAINEDSAS